MTEAQVAAALLRWTVEMKLDAFIMELERRYAPDQPRVPAGSPDGGQWTLGADSTCGALGPRRAVHVALAGRLLGAASGPGPRKTDALVHIY